MLDPVVGEFAGGAGLEAMASSSSMRRRARAARDRENLLGLGMDFEPYLEAWQQRSERQREQTALAGSRAMKIAQHLAHILVERYSATRVLLAGSLARGEFGARSDIDLAVAGAPAPSSWNGIA
jgi:hypothetical protein